MTGDEKTVYELICKEGEMNIDLISRQINIPVYKLSSILLQMEFNGAVKCFPGNIYRIVS